MQQQQRLARVRDPRSPGTSAAPVDRLGTECLAGCGLTRNEDGLHGERPAATRDSIHTATGSAQIGEVKFHQH